MSNDDASSKPDATSAHRAYEERVDVAGGRARYRRLERLGRMSARARIEMLLDGDSFLELQRYHRHERDLDDALTATRSPGDGVICGIGAIHGHPVAVYAHDVTVWRGAVGEVGAEKICRLLDIAKERSLPVITLADSDGARIAEGAYAIRGYGDVIKRTIALSDHVPQITLACGLCVGAAAYNAALTDFTAMVQDQSFMFITGARVTRAMTGEEVDIADLGGDALHARTTGACHAVLESEGAGIEWVKRLLSYVQQPVLASDDPPQRACEKIAMLLPENDRAAYNMKPLLEDIFDTGSMLELSEEYAPNLLTYMARLNGRAVVVLASQPEVRAGCLDIESSRKGARMLTWAERRGFPVITLVDTTGYLPGLDEEAGGVLIHGASLLEAYGRLTVPTISLTVRKSFGGANVLSYASGVRFAYPGARVAPMGVDAAEWVLLGAPLEDEGERARVERAAFREQWEELHGTVQSVAERGYFDRIIEPRRTRQRLTNALELLCR